MKIVSISELKAKLARYLRSVKDGEEVQIQDRGVPIAKIVQLSSESELLITPPSKNPAELGSLRFTVKLDPAIDVVELLVSDRKKR